MLLVVNAGSSSLKAELYDASAGEPIAAVSVEGIGTPQASLLPDQVYGTAATESVEAATHFEAAGLVRAWFEMQQPDVVVEAVGYRIVHGGDVFTKPTPIDDGVVEQLEQMVYLAPNHMPAAIRCIEALREVYNDATHVACFDTTFFASVPDIARVLPIPHQLADEGVRRYGFHGLSYEYLLESFRAHEGDVAAHGRVIMLHLGSGASMAACRDGQPVDMSMGFTPVSGITMSTRTGDIEPGVLLYLLREKGMTSDEVADLVAYQSGLKGISGKTDDMQQLLRTQHDDERSARAVEYFCRTIKKYIGAYAAVLGGVDSVIFAGGIGERSSEIRARILGGLEFLNIRVDNKRNSNSERLISHDLSGVGVHVIPTQEGRMVARQTAAIYKREG